jgi:branched-chain amino acid transport system permease protein
LSVAGIEEVGLVTGGIFVVVVLAFRHGIWGTMRRPLDRWRERAGTGAGGPGSAAGDAAD